MCSPRPNMNSPRPHMNSPRPHMNSPRPHMNTPRRDMNGPHLHMNGPHLHMNSPRPDRNGPRPHVNDPRPGPEPPARGTCNGPPPKVTGPRRSRPRIGRRRGDVGGDGRPAPGRPRPVDAPSRVRTSAGGGCVGASFDYPSDPHGDAGLDRGSRPVVGHPHRAVPYHLRARVPVPLGRTRRPPTPPHCDRRARHGRRRPRPAGRRVRRCRPATTCWCRATSRSDPVRSPRSATRPPRVRRSPGRPHRVRVHGRRRPAGRRSGAMRRRRPPAGAGCPPPLQSGRCSSQCRLSIAAAMPASVSGVDLERYSLTVPAHSSRRWTPASRTFGSTLIFTPSDLQHPLLRPLRWHELIERDLEAVLGEREDGLDVAVSHGLIACRCSCK